MAFEDQNKIFQAIFQNPVSGIAVMNTDFGFLRVNQAFCQITGYDEDNLLTRNEMELTPESDREEHHKIFRELSIQTYPHFTHNKNYIRPDESLIHVQQTLGVIFHENGSPLYFTSFITDISNWKNTEYELKKAKDQIQAVIDAVPGAVSWISNDLRYLGVNRYLWEKYNREYDDFKGKDVGFQGKSPDFVNFVKSFFDSGQQEISREVTTGLGKTQLTNLMVGKKYNDSKSAVFIGIDITRLKRIEKALKEQMQFNRNVIQTAPVMIVIINPDGAIVEFNQFASRSTGFAEEEVIGKSWVTTFIPEKEQVEFQKNLSLLADNNGGIVENESAVICKDKTVKLVSWKNSLLKSADEQPSNLLLTGIDITRRRQLEDQFRQSQKMEAIGRLAGGVAHDFNNLLTVIKGYSEIALIHTREGEPVQKNINEINRAANRAEDLTRQLLAFSRKQVLKLQVFNLDDVIRNLQNMVKRLIGENIDLATILSAEKGYIKADPGQIEQVVMNLIVNAKDAMESGGKITIKTELITVENKMECLHFSVPPGHYVLLTIRDSGSGIPDDMLPHIFEPFFTTKKEGKGTGLGLATVYGIVSQSNGFIYIVTQPNEGTEFQIYLPQISGKVKPSRPAVKPQAVSSGTETILVVEDDDGVRQLLCETLKMSGYNVLQAARASEALSLVNLTGSPLHLVLTDLILPHVNGKELVKKIKELSPATQSIFISGYSNSDISDYGIPEENLVFIQKPFTPSTILEAVRTVLDSLQKMPV